MLPWWRRWLSPEFTSRTVVLWNIYNAFITFHENLMTLSKSVKYFIYVYPPYINRTWTYRGPDLRMGTTKTLRILNTFKLYIFEMIQQYVQAIFNVCVWQSTESPSSKYRITLCKVLHHHLQTYHTNIYKLPHHSLHQTTICKVPLLKHHIIVFKVTNNPLQSTTQPSSKYYTIL